MASLANKSDNTDPHKEAHGKLLLRIYERDIFDQISVYIDKYLSPFLHGFRQCYSTQHCLTVMLDKWNKAIDNGKLAGALLTDLSKEFDCLNHELLITY